MNSKELNLNFNKLCEYGPIVSLLNRYVKDKNYRLVDKLLRAFNIDEVVRTFGELLRDARSRYPGFLPSSTMVAKFYEEASKDIRLVHAIVGLAYSYIDKEFFESCVKTRKEETGEGGE